MVSRFNSLISAASALAVAAVVACAANSAAAQSGEPIKIGFSMAMTGGLAANGKSALLAQKIWEEDVNTKGGLLGRPVKLIFYDDQSNPATVPGIYTKLLDVDKVDLLIGPYATAQIAPAMPIVIQRNKLFIGLLGLAVNTEFNYANYFAMIPSGPDPKPSFTKGFFDTAMAQTPKPQSVAIVAADQEFSRNASDGARENAKKAGLKIVYDKSYPPSTTDFAPIVRAIQATNPDLVVLCSYPPDSVGLVRSINEIGFKPKMVGGAMVGPQATALKTQLGPARPRKASISSATTWRRGATPSCKYFSRRSRRRRVSRTRSSPTSSAPTASKPCSATSASARTANGRSRACCRCNSTTSKATTSSNSAPWARKRCSRRRPTTPAA
jgi:branched-chain amino acid transport system substrate-binding protein